MSAQSPLVVSTQGVAPSSRWSMPNRGLRLSPEVLLAAFAFLLIALPQNNVLAGVGGSVTPARLVAGLCLLWFVIARVRGGLGMRGGHNTVRRALLTAMALFALAAGLALLTASRTALLPDGDRSMSLLLLAVGVALLACDGIDGPSGIRTVVRAIVVAATASSVSALVFSLTGFDLRGGTALPGLVVQAVTEDNTPRNGVVRALGFANHPIELAAIAIAALPLALYLVRADSRRRALWWLCTVVLVAAPVVSVSRTGVVGLLIVLLCLVVRLGPARWAGLCAALAVLGAAVAALASSRVAAIYETVVNSGNDYSIRSRLSDYDYVASSLAARPWSGQGLGTYLAPPQPFLDNQYLFTAMESGLPGVAALLLLLFVPAVCAFGVWRAGHGSLLAQPLWGDLRDAGWAIGTALLVCAAAAASFDGLAFSQFQGLTFLLVGLGGAVWALAWKPDSSSEKVVA